VRINEQTHENQIVLGRPLIFGQQPGAVQIRSYYPVPNYHQCPCTTTQPTRYATQSQHILLRIPPATPIIPMVRFMAQFTFVPVTVPLVGTNVYLTPQQQQPNTSYF